ncbi:DNA polymerase III subunit beta [Nocardia sp. NPDC003693]
MKLRLERDRLVEAVAVVSPAIPRRPAVPVLAGMRIRANEDSVSVAGFDYEVASQARIGSAEVREPGDVLVSGRLLAEIAKALPARPVELSANDERLEIVCGQSRFALPLLPVEDYPELPAAPPVIGTADHAEFSEAVAQVGVAAGKDDTLPMLTGIKIEFHADVLRLISTDRFRIAIRELDWQPAGPVDGDADAGLLVPARALVDTARSLSGSRIDIAGGAGRSILGLATGGRSHTVRTLDLPYAPYRSYLEDKRTATARLDAAALVEAIKRVSLLSPHGAQVQLSLTAAAAKLAAGGDNAGEAEETLGCEFDGEPLAVAFNPRYLLDGLTALRAGTVEIALNGPTRAAHFRAARPDSETGHGLTYVLMPVRLAG